MIGFFPSSEDDVIVRLDMFSGRPNPEWELENEAATKIMQAVQRIEKQTAQPLDLPGLGYRGFLISEAGESLRVYGGMLQKGSYHLLDTDRELEKLILKASKGHLPENLWNLLRGEITGS